MSCVKTCHDNCRWDTNEKWKCYLFTKEKTGSWTTESEALPCGSCGCSAEHHSNTGKIWKQVSYLETVHLSGKKGKHD
jgi:predicted metal-binding protein